jgi:glycosyltransferase involved in cell wall biosynthesis
MVTVRSRGHESLLAWVNGRYVRFTGGLAKLSPADAYFLASTGKYEIVEDAVSKCSPDALANRLITWASNTDTFTGYGKAAIRAMTTLSKQGADIAWVGRQIDADRSLVEELKELSQKDPTCRPVVSFCQPGSYNFSVSDVNIGYTPWETTGIPKSWLEKMNRATAILTTCRQNAEDFANCGVERPIGVFPHGIDTSEFPFIERKHRGTYTFGTFGKLSIRKGTDILVKAFEEEFKTGEDVKLILKTTDMFACFGQRDSRIKVMSSALDSGGLLNFLGGLDCFCFPTRGEGFGLPPLEAMSTGLPVIVTDWSGPVDYGDTADTLFIGHKMVPAKNFSDVVYKEDCGEWAEPDIESLMKQMRWCYENRERAAGLGVAASKRVQRDWTWEASCSKFFPELERILK